MPKCKECGRVEDCMWGETCRGCEKKAARHAELIHTLNSLKDEIVEFNMHMRHNLVKLRDRS